VHLLNGAAEMITNLAEISHVKAGHPFRGRIPEDPRGEVLAVQIRDITTEGGVNWGSVIKTNVSGRKQPDFLKTGHVLFSARGQKNHAALVDDVPQAAVCAPHFFLLEVRDLRVIHPAFLAWQLNQEDSQRYFARAAQGSAQINVNRQDLENTPITLPSLERQLLIVELYKAANREKQLHMQLIENRHKELTTIAHQIMSDL
jgi:restriction endonuclease S subunit